MTKQELRKIKTKAKQIGKTVEKLDELVLKLELLVEAAS